MSMSMSMSTTSYYRRHTITKANVEQHTLTQRDKREEALDKDNVCRCCINIDLGKRNGIDGINGRNAATACRLRYMRVAQIGEIRRRPSDVRINDGIE